MLSKMSKSDKTMFYYLGLTLLLLIVLGILFGISSVKESFGRRRRGKKRGGKKKGGKKKPQPEPQPVNIYSQPVNKVDNCIKEGVILAEDLAERSMGDPNSSRHVNWKDDKLQSSIVREIRNGCIDTASNYTMSESEATGRRYGLNAIKTRAGW